jgi:DNA-binding MarR family transcriptional regulator
VAHKSEHESISFLLGMIGKAQRSRANEALSETGLYAGQERVLLELSKQDGLTQSQLVETMCVQPPTVSKMLDRMEKTGLVERHPDAEDSRVTRVCLTDQGRNLNEDVCALWHDLEARVIEGLSIEERIILRRLLLQIYENLTK